MALTDEQEKVIYAVSNVHHTLVGRTLMWNDDTDDDSVIVEGYRIKYIWYLVADCSGWFVANKNTEIIYTGDNRSDRYCTFQEAVKAVAMLKISEIFDDCYADEMA